MNRLTSRPLALRYLLSALAFLVVGTTLVAAETPKISPGMTGDEVRQRWGEPRQIRPMESPEGRAEVWTYERLVARRVEPVATEVAKLPTFSLNVPFGLGTEDQLVYDLQTTWVHQEMQLLMFNDQLVSWKERYRQRRSHQR